jgi:hypothetical protein
MEGARNNKHNFFLRVPEKNTLVFLTMPETIQKPTLGRMGKTEELLQSKNILPFP